VHGGIVPDGGEAQLHDNLAGHLDGYFGDPSSGVLALTSAATGALGRGVPLADVPDDICRRPRTEHPNLRAWESKKPAQGSRGPTGHDGPTGK